MTTITMDTKSFGDNEVRLPDQARQDTHANMTPSRDRAETAMKEVKQEVGKYADRANELVDTAKQRTGAYIDRAKEQINEVSDAMKERGQEAMEQVEEAGQSLDEYAHKNPWHVAAIAAVLGAGLAALLCTHHRKCRD